MTTQDNYDDEDDLDCCGEDLAPITWVDTAAVWAIVSLAPLTLVIAAWIIIYAAIHHLGPFHG